MKKKILPALLLGLAVLGCENMTNGGENGKTEDELRAERNRPIYEQFIGEWDEYDDEDFSTKIASPRVIATNSEITIKNGSFNHQTTINLSDIIYTLDEFKKMVDYDGSVSSSELKKDGFIKFKWGNNFEFFKYHFYDKDKFSLKVVTYELVTVDGAILYCKRVGGSSSSGSGTSVELPGAYGLTVGSYDCTLTFNDDGTYTFDHPVGTDRSGTWSQNGGEVTMTYTVPESETVSEVFITTEEGDVVTLTLKDNSASVSNILASFNLAATSVALTRE